MNGFRITPGIKKILIANIVVFALQQVISQQIMIGYFSLYWDGLVNHYFVWTPISYMFLHGGFGHIFFNMFALWIFGTELESSYGTDRFYILYFLGGLIGGLGHLVITALAGASIPTIGASAGVMAIVVAYGFTFPDRIIYLNFFIPVKAIWLAVGYVVLDLIGAFSGAGSGIAHLAHLGGALVGFIFTRSRTKFGGILSAFQNIPKVIKVEKVNKPNKPKKQKQGFTIREGSSDDEKAAFYQKKVDEILDKINEVGYLNLSDEDRDLLDRGSKFLRDYHRRHGN